jgi:nucleoside-diphosphate-sugar epimerase
MKITVLLIGKNSFIGKNIYKVLKKKLNITYLNIDIALKKKNIFFKKFKFIINCSINTDYVKKNYKKKNDFDLLLAKKIQFTNCKYIFLSSRKVYKPKFNITEETKTKPTDQYGKNKLLSENKLKNILHDKLLVLRISNIIGLKQYNRRKVHNTFLDYFYSNIKNNNIILFKKSYKDFLSINQFVHILFLLIKKNAYGTFNVSLGRKVYLKNIIKWLNFFNKKKFNYIQGNKDMNLDSFTLNNNKLKKIINCKILINDLKKDCLDISKIFFIK